MTSNKTLHGTKEIELLGERRGEGIIAEKGCVVTYNARLFPRKGDEVTFDANLIAAYREVLVSPHLAYRNVGISVLIPPDAMLRMQLWEQDIKSHADRPGRS